MITTALLAILTAAAAPSDDDALRRRVDKILAKTPLVDGHNDTPWALRSRVAGRLGEVPFDEHTHDLERPMHTDIPRLRAGGAGAVFWSVWIPTSLEGPEAVVTVLEQIDLVHRMVERWPDHLELALTADDVRRIHKQGRVASLIGMEGGHSIANNLAALRTTYRAGARYLTLTHWQTIDWADAATDAPEHDGLSPFGEEVVREMNRLGMLVDLSHVSAPTMHDALDVSAAPVIFSHSGAYGVNPHPRNVPDAVLDRLPDNGGVVMVDFLPNYVSEAVFTWWTHRQAEAARLEALHLGQPVAAEQALAAWEAAHPKPRSTLGQVADHIDHIAKRIGPEHVGIGSDFDGMHDQPDGLDDVAAVPALLVELLRRGYSDSEVAGIAGGNALRALQAAEEVAARLQTERPASEADLEGRE
jgi:membrane dipeptidase